MAAAVEAGVTRLFRVGGAHAIAALAYGTGRVPRVDKIVGPGNRYVAAAKALVAPTARSISKRARRNWSGSPTAPGPTGSPCDPHRAGRARPGRARIPRHDVAARGRGGSRCGRPAGAGRRRRPQRRWPVMAARWWPARGARRSPGQSHRARAPGDRRRVAGGAAATVGGHGVRGRLYARTGRRRLRHRVEPRAADVRRGAVPRRAAMRPTSCGWCPCSASRAPAAARWRRGGASPWRASKGCSGHAALDRSEGEMSTGYLYEPLPDVDAGHPAASEREYRRLLARRGPAGDRAVTRRTGRVVPVLRRPPPAPAPTRSACRPTRCCSRMASMRAF